MDITAVVFLGASRFTHIPSFSNPSFKSSKSDLEDYLRRPSPLGLGVSSAAILDLFDLPLAPGQQLRKVGDFLDELKQAYPDAVRNLIIYYVGHGYQAGAGGRDYFLALTETDRNVFDTTGLRFTSLSDALKQRSKSFRFFYILDCCFAGEALRAFQGDSDAVGRLLTAPLRVDGPRFKSDVPRRGAAALCATSPDDEARAPEALGRTVFTDALVEVLARGDKELQEAMTLADVRDLAWEHIREKHKDVPENQIRPYLGSPDQTEGDIAAAVPLFPNPSFPNDRQAPGWQAERERLEAARQAAARQRAEEERQAAAKRRAEEERQAAARQRAEEERRAAAERQTKEERHGAAERQAKEQRQVRPAPVQLFAAVGLVIAGLIVVYMLVRQVSHSGPALVTTSSASAGPSKNKPGNIKVLIASVHATGSAYPVGDDHVPAEQVERQLRQQVISELTQTGHFSVLDLDSGGDGSGQAAAADLKLVAQIESFGYQRHARALEIDSRPLVSYSGGAALSYQLIDVATRQIVFGGSVSTTEEDVPPMGPSTLPLVVNTQERLRQLETGLISKVVPEIVMRVFPVTVVSRKGTAVVLSEGGKILREHSSYQVVVVSDEVKDPQTEQSRWRTEQPCCVVDIDQVAQTSASGSLRDIKVNLDAVPPARLQLRQVVGHGLPTGGSAVGGQRKQAPRPTTSRSST
jgi:hypothetical protein